MLLILRTFDGMYESLSITVVAAAALIGDWSVLSIHSILPCVYDVNYHRYYICKLCVCLGDWVKAGVNFPSVHFVRIYFRLFILSLILFYIFHMC